MLQQVLPQVTVASGVTKTLIPSTFPNSEHRITTTFHSSANKQWRTWKRPALFLLVKKLLGDSVLVLCIILWRWACSRYCRIVPTTIPSRCRPFLLRIGSLLISSRNIYISISFESRYSWWLCRSGTDAMNGEYSFQINSFDLPSPCTTLASVYSDKYLHVR